MFSLNPICRFYKLYFLITLYVSLITIGSGLELNLCRYRRKEYRLGEVLQRPNECEISRCEITNTITLGRNETVTVFVPYTCVSFTDKPGCLIVSNKHVNDNSSADFPKCCPFFICIQEFETTVLWVISSISVINKDSTPVYIPTTTKIPVTTNTTNRTGPGEPVELVKPVEAVKPGEPVTPEGPIEPGIVGEPGESILPITTEEPVKPQAAEEPAYPIVSAQSNDQNNQQF